MAAKRLAVRERSGARAGVIGKTEDVKQLPVGRGSLGRRTQVVNDLRAAHA